jgi:MazG family protein
MAIQPPAADMTKATDTPPNPGIPTREEKFRLLCELIARLRSADGCPWDRARKRGEVGHDLIGEAYEVLEALADPDPAKLNEELGDLLFEILFLARIAEEEGDFNIGSVLTAVTDKMVRRHPHVFARTGPLEIEEVRRNWKRIKKEVEKREDPPLLPASPSEALPTLALVQQVTVRASRAGFDWPDIGGVLAKLAEETVEFEAALQTGSPEKIGEEAGDLLFTLVNLCRFARVDAEAALRAALRKFTGRFAAVQKRLAAQGRTPADASAAELDALWNEVKSD